MATEYAKSIMESSFCKDLSGQPQYSDLFNITIDEYKVNFMWNITSSGWNFEISDIYIEHVDEEGHQFGDYIHIRKHATKYNADFFPEFKYGEDIRNKVTLKLLTKFIERIYNWLDDLSFNKQLGRFVTKSVNTKITIRNFYFDKFIPKDHKCSVCLDEGIQTKTPCGHTLCYPCWSVLKKKVCPECRGDIENVIE
jgi:hypothetical protein